MFFGLGLPFLQLFLFSGGDNSDFNILNYAMPIIVVITAMVLCFMDSAFSHAYARQIKFLRRLRMTPVKPVNYITAGILSRLAVLVVFTITFIGISAISFDVDIAGRNWLLFGGVLLLVFAMLYLFSMFIANVMKRAKTSQNLLYVVFFGMLFLSGAFFPTDQMPAALRVIAENTPAVFSINILQYAWQGTNLFYGYSFIAVSALTVLFGVLSVKFFSFE